jgi:hypothetical protein
MTTELWTTVRSMVRAGVRVVKIRRVDQSESPELAVSSDTVTVLAEEVSRLYLLGY